MRRAAVITGAKPTSAVVSVSTPGGVRREHAARTAGLDVEMLAPTRDENPLAGHAGLSINGTR
jgi:hypothetical protein